ncbi:MAG: hypothetical protein RR620_04095 [Clostridium sp.]
MKRLLYILILFLIILPLTSCNSSKDIDNIVNDIEKSIENDENKENVYVQKVMTGNLNIDNIVTIGDVFENYFGYPTWEYFKSTEGQDIVEFTGNCMYDGKEVECIIQFVISGDNLEITYLSFNDISQNQFVLSSLLESIYYTYNRDFNIQSY